MADIIHLNGTVAVAKSGSNSVITLWTSNYNEKLQKDLKTRYTLWMNVPGDWTDGTWVEIEGTLSVRPSIQQDGTPRTYLDSKGNTITAHDLNVNDVRIINAKPKDNSGAIGRDLDDERKYGKPNLIDENPF